MYCDTSWVQTTATKLSTSQTTERKEARKPIDVNQAVVIKPSNLATTEPKDGNTSFLG